MMRYALTPAEAAKALGLSPAAVYRAIRAGELEAEKVGGRLLVPARALEVRFGSPVEVEAA